MRLSLTEREQQIKDEVSSFLDANQPRKEDIPSDFDGRTAFLLDWQRKLHEAGLVGLAWPEEYGGRGGSQMEQIIVYQEMARRSAPDVIGEIGLEVVGPSLIAHGTDEQKSRFITPILSAEEIWCQGFSEPDAGSDLGSLKTRADDNGDHFLISGQKTWTSFSKYAQWCAVLARTNSDGPPHRGISYLLVDLAADGIEVRPLVQSTGDPEFGEVYFDEVVVPKEMLLGELNGGWKIAMHTLAHERGPAAMRNQMKLRGAFDRLVRDARRLPRDGAAAIESPEVQLTLARALISLEALKCQTYMSAGRAVKRGAPGPESSVDKLVSSLTEQQIGAAALEILGPYAALVDGSPWSVDTDAWHAFYLYGRSTSVFGGSAQIQKNIIAERILGLPRGA
jgi:alkylation response protein AidB-like acyl-CoA dehydrogenase